MTAKRTTQVVRLLVLTLSFIPFSLLLWNAFTGGLSANPIQDITNETGIWALRFVMLTLAVTPLRILTGWSVVARLRRMLGLFAFFYAMLHFSTYVYLDKFFTFDEILRDVAKRPFITVGFTALVLMIPLAITSADRIAKWMGGRRWRLLHRLVYGVAVAGVVHYLWLVKADRLRPLIYGAILAALLGYRLWIFVKPQLGVLVSHSVPKPSQSES